MDLYSIKLPGAATIWFLSWFVRWYATRSGTDQGKHGKQAGESMRRNAIGEHSEFMARVIQARAQLAMPAKTRYYVGKHRYFHEFDWNVAVVTATGESVHYCYQCEMFVNASRMVSHTGVYESPALIMPSQWLATEK